MNGSGAPTIGRIPITIPLLTRTYKNIVNIKVPDKIREKLSVALMEMLIPLKVARTYNVIRRRTPINPNSSPKAEKIKSVWFSGRKSNFDWVPFIYPFPNSPPDPSAIFDCTR